jgi:hypothetical protein
MDPKTLFRDFPRANEAKELSLKYQEAQKQQELVNLVNTIAYAFKTGAPDYTVDGEQYSRLLPYKDYLSNLGFELTRDGMFGRFLITFKQEKK